MTMLRWQHPPGVSSWQRPSLSWGLQWGFLSPGSSLCLPPSRPLGDPLYSAPNVEVAPLSVPMLCDCLLVDAAQNPVADSLGNEVPESLSKGLRPGKVSADHPACSIPSQI